MILWEELQYEMEGGAMEVKKIRSVKHEYFDRIGPAEVITLGIKSGDITILCGSFYQGPYTNETITDSLQKIEALIDHIVWCCADREAAK